MNRTHRSQLLIGALVAAVVCSGNSSTAAETPPKSRALLVGCTTYDFSRERSLHGPANDVEVMSELLVDRFGFASTEIRTLIEGTDLSKRPTRANIVREMKALIQGASAGQKIVLFFAGHGCQQPDQVPPQTDDPEPDGLDEVFLPADIGPWSAEVQSVRNAIVDDEFRRWTAQLLQRNVDLLVIFDSCHSGSGLRGFGDEQPRRVEPEELIPADVLGQVRGQTEATRGTPANEQPAFDPLARGQWVAIYAAQPEEVTVETRLPRRSPDARPQGIFTYTLCQALSEGAVPTYRELIQRIRAEYMAHGRYAPTPLIEGHDLDRSVLGAERGQPSFSLERDAKGKWFIRAGQLHGLTKGSILAVRPPRAAGDSSPVGYVQVVDSGLAQAAVSPCAFNDEKVATNLPVGGLCRPVYVDYGDLRLRVAVDNEVSRGAKDPFVASLRVLAEEDDTPLVLVDVEDEADWYISRDLSAKTARWLLSPRSSQLQSRGSAAESTEPPTRLAINHNDGDRAEETLRRLNRASNLLALASRLGSQSTSGGLNVQLEVLYQAPGRTGEPEVTSFDRPPTLAAGGKLQLRVTNRDSRAVDFTLLFVDAQFGIEPIFPQGFASDNRLPPGKSFETAAMSITAETLGREHLVLIAVPSERVPVNFTFLAQPSLQAAQAVAQRSRGGDKPSPFESLLQNAGWGGGSTRGLSMPETAPVLQIRSWIVHPERD